MPPHFDTMARKWSNHNLPGALHYVTGNVRDRIPIFKRDDCCEGFLKVFQNLLHDWPAKLIAYVLMPDHIHLIVNPRDGCIREFTGRLKGLSAYELVEVTGGNASKLKTRMMAQNTKSGRKVLKLNRCGALG